MRTTLLLALLALTLCDNAQKIKSYLLSHRFTKAGAAGLMGNLFAESGLRPDIYERAHEKRLGMSQQEYVKKTNSGTYTNFVKDGVGFGLAQWTFSSRKQALLNSCRGKIADLNCQLGYLVHELKNDYKGVYSKLTSSNNVNECCDKVLFEFERPAKAQSQKEKRRSYCKKYF